VIVTHTTRTVTNDQRRAEWAYRYAMGGYHHEPPLAGEELTERLSELHTSVGTILRKLDAEPKP
jgi:hypothetical protein